MSIITKQSGETLILDIDFADKMMFGDSLSAITSVTESTGGITIASTSITGTKVQGTYSGGTDGTMYHIVATVTTTNGETLEADVHLLVANQPSAVMLASYFTLSERVGHYLFGKRSGFSSDEVYDIKDCIRDGLREVYSAHDWSFFRPLVEITTTAPYATGTITVASGVVTLTGGTFPSWAADGLLKVSDNYYSVATRDGDTQITLDDTSVSVTSASAYELARPAIPMPANYDAISGDADMTYHPDQNELYPPVKHRHDKAIRTWQQNDPYFDRPLYYSVRAIVFDATVGSRKEIAFYPSPDAAYVLQVPMILRPTMISESNIYPVGGETLSHVIMEACLAAAERNFEEREHVHSKRFTDMLMFAVTEDLRHSSPTSLGSDRPKRDRRATWLWDEDYLRESRIGTVTLDGTAQ